jgi:hypothetical protein
MAESFESFSLRGTPELSIHYVYGIWGGGYCRKLITLLRENLKWRSMLRKGEIDRDIPQENFAFPRKLITPHKSVKSGRGIEA